MAVFVPSPQPPAGVALALALALALPPPCASLARRLELVPVPMASRLSGSVYICSSSMTPGRKRSSAISSLPSFHWMEVAVSTILALSSASCRWSAGFCSMSSRAHMPSGMPVVSSCLYVRPVVKKSTPSRHGLSARCSSSFGAISLASGVSESLAGSMVSGAHCGTRASAQGVSGATKF